MNVLIVEDNKKMNKIMSDYYRKSNYTVFNAFDGEEAIEIFEENNIDVVILDIMMPKLDGFSVCKRLRKKSNVVIIIVSARAEEDDKLEGFEYGADEYVTKPYSQKVLVARTEALLKRVYKTNQIIKKGRISIDSESMRIYVDENEISLTAREYDLLLKFVLNENKVFSRDMLIREIWNYDYLGDGRIVDTNIKVLRRKLNICGSYIKTIFGKGYKFEVNHEDK